MKSRSSENKSYYARHKDRIKQKYQTRKAEKEALKNRTMTFEQYYKMTRRNRSNSSQYKQFNEYYSIEDFSELDRYNVYDEDFND